MDSFAEYILDEKNLASKMEIMCYLDKKCDIYFDKSVILKTEIARMFIRYMKVDVNTNLTLTACLLCNCKKVNNVRNPEEIRSYAKKGADYLETLGFGKRFCKVCEEVNRYSNSNPRERESDVLELVDQFGGMLLDRPERIGFKPDEAMALLEYRNLKDVYNRYLHTFREFVKMMESIQFSTRQKKISSLSWLVKIYNETDDIKAFIQKVCYGYRPKVDKSVELYREKIKREMFKNIDESRPLFSQETTRKILSRIAEENATQGNLLKGKSNNAG